MLNSGIKNIIFDLGGVLLNLDYSRTAKAFRKLSPAFLSFDPVYTGLKDKELFENFEKGFLSPGQFRDGIRSILLREMKSKSNESLHTDEMIDNAWNVMLLDFPADRLKLLQRLKADYRLFLLSNTNAIHLEAVAQILFNSIGHRNLGSVFEKEYFSNLMGMRKPDKEIFHFVLEENKMKPEETFYIDDSPQHVQGAATLGIQSYLLKKGEEVQDLF